MRASSVHEYYIVGPLNGGEVDIEMELEIGPHLEETELEQYSMGRLPGTRVEEFEGHFLACDTCQDRLLEMEAYVNAMRSASPKVREARTSYWKDFFRWPRLAWVGALSLSAASIAVGILMLTPRDRTEMALVTLQASRGIAGPAIAQAPSETGLSLNVDLTELPAAPSYRMEVVNIAGQPVWETVAQGRDGKMAQALPKGLRAGQYYVRLYLPEGTLLREFSLRVVAH
jgi:hypothetical protein